MEYRKIMGIREDMRHCALCEDQFLPNQMTHLATVDKRANVLLCTRCADECINGGAEKVLNLPHKAKS